MRDGDGVELQMPAPRGGTLASLGITQQATGGSASYGDSPPFPHAPKIALPAALWRLRRWVSAARAPVSRKAARETRAPCLYSGQKVARIEGYAMYFANRVSDKAGNPAEETKVNGSYYQQAPKPGDPGAAAAGIRILVGPGRVGKGTMHMHLGVISTVYTCLQYPNPHTRRKTGPTRDPT